MSQILLFQNLQIDLMFKSLTALFESLHDDLDLLVHFEDLALVPDKKQDLEDLQSLLFFSV